MNASHKRTFFWASILLLSTGITLNSTIQPTSAESFSYPDAQTEASTQTLWVDPNLGDDSNYVGKPLKTISKALSLAQSGTVIKLKAGKYSEATGETFPLILPSGVSLVGNEADFGESVEINGGGKYASSWWGRQNVAVLAKGSSVIKGVKVTNPQMRGTGIWIESSAARVSHSSFTQNLREGIFVAGNSSPTIQNNRFYDNSANGLSISNQSKGLVANNSFVNTGFGITVSEDAAPMIQGNEVKTNVDGIVISHRAKPHLYGNQILNNKRDGVVMIAEAAPILGTSTKPGKNMIKGNGRHAINNASSSSFISNNGNDIYETPKVLDEAPAVAPALQNEASEVVAVSTQKSAPDSVIPPALSSAKSISIDGKKYISVEDMLRLLQ